MAEQNGQFCLSKAVQVTGPASLCNPTADAGGPYDVCTGDVVTLDGSGSTALAGTIVAWDWDLDNDGQYDDAFGQTVQHTWNTPGTYPVGLKVTSSDSLVLNDVDMINVTVNTCQVTVGIDIYPNRVPNRVILSRNYTLYVAVLGSANFDVTTLNSSTVKFGRTGTEASPVRAPLIRDLNGDGYLDAMYGFMTNDCGFALGDTTGILTGKLSDGTDVSGSDSVLVMP
jgi:PKD repeat protein